MGRDPNPKRGRPPKFGRAADLISLTLPRDVIDWLASIDDDMAWAIVKLYERATRTRKVEFDVASLVRFPGDRALIQVDAALFNDIPGVALIPLADGRAFLALEPGKGAADLELLVLDRLDQKHIITAERTALNKLRQLLKQWRQEGILFESRAIIVAQGLKSSARKARS
jgi:hypothetical protein